MSYGNIKNVPTTGASRATSQHVGCDGVRGSEKIAENDSTEMNNYKGIIQKVGNAYGIEPALIAGIISRESSAGVTLRNGWGDGGKAWGLMQVDVTPTGGRHEARGGWNSEEHLRHGTEILVYFIGAIQRKFPSWSKEMQLKGGIAAYNAGDGRVTSSNVDAETFNGDYANDVVARAKYYKTRYHY